MWEVEASPWCRRRVCAPGVGAGTVIRVDMRVLGRPQTFRAVVTEPEPGRVLVETNDNGYVTTFTVEPRAEGQHAYVTIATEMTDYSKRSFEEGTATFQKLASARDMRQVMEIQTDYAKRAYEDYMEQLSKIGAMYQSFAKDAFKPVERAFRGSR